MELIKQDPIIEATPYFELTHLETIPNKTLYDKFLNWVSVEFELFLQDNLDGLQIFFPGGYCSITNCETNNNQIEFKVIVKSKYKQKGIQINNQIYAILSHILNLKKHSNTLY